MATARLTNDLRDTIRRNATKNAFSVEKAKYQEQFKTFSKKVYDKMVLPDIQAHIAAVPKEFFHHSEQPTIRLSPNKESAGDRLNLKFDKGVAIPEQWRYGNAETIVDAKLYEHWTKIDKANDEVKDQEKKLVESLNQVLYAATTVGKLIELWPEGEKFIPDYAKRPVGGRMMPVVCVANLNELLSKALPTGA